MWAVEVVDVVADHQLDQYGIEARDVDGLDGIVTAPFLHVGFAHLLANTIPFVIMGLRDRARGRPPAGLRCSRSWPSSAGSAPGSSPPEGTIHVGASGVVFGFATYLIARGWFNRRPGRGRDRAGRAGGVGRRAARRASSRSAGISWQGHLFGAIGGVVAARVLARGDAEPAPPRRSICRVEVTVRLFAMLRERAGARSSTLELPEGARVRDALASEPLAALADGIPLVMAVNREYADGEQVLDAGDELALIPPVSGGSTAARPGCG